MPNVSLNIKSRWVKGDQVKKDDEEQIISIVMQTFNSKNIALHKSLIIESYPTYHLQTKCSYHEC
jgi:hypothetical protein